MPDLFEGKHVLLKGARELLAVDVTAEVRARFAARLRPRTWTPAGGEEITCAEWPGAVNTDGHGVMRIGARLVLTHRLAYALAHEVCPAGLVVDHFRCSNRRCCEPMHLRLTTPEGNTPAIYGARTRTAGREARAIRAIFDGRLVTYPSVDAMFAAMERRAIARRGPRCKHGYFSCTTCRAAPSEEARPMPTNTWSDEPTRAATVAERRVPVL